MRRLKTPHLHDPDYFRASRNAKVVAILDGSVGQRALRHRQAQHEVGGVWRAGRMAPGLGVLSAHQRRSRRGRDHARRCRHGERPDDGRAGQPPGPDLGPSRAGRAVLRRDGPGGAATSTCRGALPCLGKAGSVTVHHVRAVHGSATNFSGRERRFLLYQYRAADAWPLLGFKDGIDKFNELLLAGEPTIEPRLAPVPVRLPLPPAEHQGSIYENQRASAAALFRDRAPMTAAPRRSSRATLGKRRPQRLAAARWSAWTTAGRWLSAAQPSASRPVKSVLRTFAPLASSAWTMPCCRGSPRSSAASSRSCCRGRPRPRHRAAAAPSRPGCGRRHSAARCCRACP